MQSIEPNQSSKNIHLQSFLLSFLKLLRLYLVTLPKCFSTPPATECKHTYTNLQQKMSSGADRTLSRFARTQGAERKKVVRVISEQSVQDALHAVDNRESSLDDYLNKTLLRMRLKDALKELVHKDFLPRNPYTYLVPHMRQQEIQNELAGSRVVGLLNKIIPPLPATQYITNVRENFDHFGTSLLLKNIDTDSLTDLNESLRLTAGCLIDNVSGEYGGEGKEPHVKAISSVIAPTIFYGNILPYIEKICINHDYFCCAKKFDLGTKAFAGEIVRNLFEFKNSGKTISEGKKCCCLVQKK